MLESVSSIFYLSEREDHRKDEYHHYTHQNLERKSDLYIIHECILTGRHDQSVRWSGEW